MKRTLATILSLCMIFVLCACGTAAPVQYTTEALAEKAGNAVSTLNIALGGEPSTLDLHTATEDFAGCVVRSSVFEQLVAVDNDGNIVNELAESVEMSEDATVYTYHLRQGVKFHNGEEMTAADVVASLNRWVENAAAVLGLLGENRFEAVDDYTVSVTLASPSAYLNEMIAGISQYSAIMPASVIEGIGEDGLLNEYIGTGPYMYSEWKPDQYIKLVRFADYAPYGTEGEFSGATGNKVASYENVYFYFPGDEATIANGLLTGEYDISSNLSPDSFGPFEGNEDFIMQAQEAEVCLFIFNKSEGHGANQTVRQAVQALVNCDDAMFAAYGDEAYYSLYSAYSFSNQPAWYSENGSEYYNQNNPDRAIELFNEAGWTENDTFRILCPSDTPEYLILGQVVAEELRGIGINSEVLAYEWSTMAEIRNNKPGEYDAFITSFSPKVLPSMNLFLSPTWSGWCTDERIQNDLAAISAAVNQDDAQQTWFDLQQYMYEEYVPVVKFGAKNAVIVAAAGISDISYREGAVVWVNSSFER